MSKLVSTAVVGVLLFVALMAAMWLSKPSSSSKKKQTSNPTSKKPLHQLIRNGLDDLSGLPMQPPQQQVEWEKRSDLKKQRDSCPEGLLENDVKFPPFTPPSERLTVLVKHEAVPTAQPPSTWQDSLIPPIIVQTSRSKFVPRKMAQQIAKVRQMHPGFHHYYFDDEMARDFIKGHMPSRVVDMFDTLIPGAYKADLFRYVFLYVKGGVYLDADTVLLTSLDDLINQKDRFLGALPSSRSMGMHFLNNFIGCVPKHPLILGALQEAIHMVSNQDLGRSPTAVTGGDSLTRSFALMRFKEMKAGKRYEDGTVLFAAKKLSPCAEWTYMSLGGQPFLHGAYREAPQDMRWYRQQPHYQKMWHDGKVFGGSGASGEEETHARASCPHQITKKDVEVAQDQFVSVVDRTLLVIAAVHNATMPVTTVSSSIPRSVLQVGATNELPNGMWKSIMNIRTANPTFSFYYRDLKYARYWLSVHSDAGILEIFDNLASTTLKLRLFTLWYLYENGGFYINSAAQMMTTPLDAVLSMPHTTIILPTDNEHIFTPIFAATPRNEIISVALDLFVKDLQDAAAGIDVEEFSIGRAIVAAFQKIRKTSITSVMNRRDDPVRFLVFKQLSQCMYGEIFTSRSNKVPFIYTHYPKYGRDMAWYPHENVTALKENNDVYSEESGLHFTLPPLSKAVQDDAKDTEDLEELAAEARGRQLCPAGQTEVVAYHPAPTNPTQRHMILMPRFTPAKLPPNKDKHLRIPLKMLQTGKYDYVPIGMYRAMLTNMEMHPEWEHHYHSDRSAREFIKANLNDTVLDAFDDIIPGAYKSDFFRYIWLYVNGGMYIDADQVAVKHVQVQDTDTFVSAEDSGGDKPMVYNAIMLATRQHPIIAEVFRVVLHYVRNRMYGENTLDITGPAALQRAFTTVVGEMPQSNRRYANYIRLMQYYKGPRCAIGELRWNGNTQWLTRYPSYKREMKWYLGQSHYWTMYDRREVYALDALLKQVRYSGWLFSEDELEAIKYHMRHKHECKYGMTNGNPLDRSMPLAVREEYFAKESIGVPSFLQATETDPLMDQRSIPNTLIQMTKHAIVPKRTYNAIMSIRDANPKLSHFFFSIKTARAFIRRQKNATVLEAFDAVRPFIIKRNLFTLYYLYVNGGHSVISGAKPGYNGDAYVSLLDSMRDDDTFVAVESPGYELNMDFMATSPKNPIVGAMLESSLQVILDHARPVKHTGYCGEYNLGKSFERVVGGRPGPSVDFGNGVRLLSMQKSDFCYHRAFFWHGDEVLEADYSGETEDLAWYHTVVDNLDYQHNNHTIYHNDRMPAQGRAQFYRNHPELTQHPDHMMQTPAPPRMQSPETPRIEETEAPITPSPEDDLEVDMTRAPEGGEATTP